MSRVEPELDALSEVAAGLGRTARIALRVNPDVDAKTHAKISTGKAENKFGIPFDDAPRLYAKAAKLPGIEVAGIHMHIGSQITDLEPFRDAFRLMRELARACARDGHAIEHLDLGGGLGVPYRGGNDMPPSPQEYAAGRARDGGRSGPEDRAGARPHDRRQRRRAGGARDLRQARPRQDLHHRRCRHERPDPADAVRGASRDLAGARKAPAGQPPIVQDVVGPVCETGDYLALDRKLPPFAAGDLMAFMTAGAYGAVMSSTYNSRLLVPEVLVKGDDYAVVRPRPSYDDLIGQDRLPDWLA